MTAKSSKGLLTFWPLWDSLSVYIRMFAGDPSSPTSNVTLPQSKQSWPWLPVPNSNQGNPCKCHSSRQEHIVWEKAENSAFWDFRFTFVFPKQVPNPCGCKRWLGSVMKCQKLGSWKLNRSHAESGLAYLLVSSPLQHWKWSTFII